MRNLYITIVFLFFLLVQGIKASEIHNNFSNLSVLDGLSHGWINVITQDQQGFMWFGTDDGLNKYDGKSFQVFRQIPGDTNSLYSNSITELFIEENGNLWIGTSAGVNYFDFAADQISRIDLGGEYNVTELIEIDSNRIAIATYTGLFIYNKTTQKSKPYYIYSSHNELGKNRFRSVILYKKNLLVFTEGGIYSFNTDTYLFDIFYPDNESFKGENVRVSQMINGVLWIGMTLDGLYYCNLGKDNTIRKFRNNELSDLTVFSVFPLNSKQILLGTENEGILIIDPRKREAESPTFRKIKNEFAEPKGLISNSIYNIYRDIQENIWFGTFNGISYQYAEGFSFGSLTKQPLNSNSLDNSMVNCIVENKGKVWVGTENGINIFNSKNEKLKHIRYSENDANSLLAHAIITMEQDANGNIWAGSWSGGIDIINDEGLVISQIKTDEYNRQLPQKTIMSIAKDKSDNMWVGTMGAGVVVFNKNQNKIRNYRFSSKDKTSLSNDWIRSIFITSKEEVWVLTHDNVNLLNKNINGFIQFDHNENDTTTIAGTTTINMYEDKSGTLWFATTSGLSRFNRSDSSFTNFYTSNGLPNNYIQSLLDDNSNHLWIATNSGLSKFINPTATPENALFENYDIRDGLISNNFIRRAAHKGQSGKVYFGTRNGLVMFNPNNIRTNTYLPSVYITGLYVNNKLVSPNDNTKILTTNIRNTKSIKLKHSQSDISFDFSALNYVVSGKNNYKYKLIGYDKNWINHKQNSLANYTNIPHGEYTFHVIASNNSNVWNKMGAKIEVKILPPWYRTKLAYLAFLTVIFLLILSYRYFIIVQTKLESKLKMEIVEKENLNKIAKIKTKFFTNISHEFLTPLSLIISPLDSLINSGETLQNNIKPIYRNAKRLQRLINQMLDISKIEADHIALLVSKGDLNAFMYDIFIAFKSLAENKNILFTYESIIKNETIYFDSDKIEKILYNLLSNAIKFTPKNGSVKVLLSKTESRIIIRVSDTGIGINEKEKEKIFESFYRSKDSKNKSIMGSGVGLSLVRGLVNVYDGNIELESKVDRGTTFSIFLPYKTEHFHPSAISDKELTTNSSLDIIDEISENLEIKTKSGREEEIWPSVLIVEDNKELNNHIASLLSKTYNIKTALNGKDGFELAQKYVPDLIITDVVMPIMDGTELLQSIRRNASTSHIPVIMLTAKVDVEDKIKGLEIGADAYITKPFDQKHLETSIVNLINSREILKKAFKKNVVIEPSKVNITSIDENFIEKAINIVDENMSNPEFSIEFLAKEVCMSRVQLHRKLTGLLGMSASNFVRELKIKRAAELLTKGQLTVSQVMYEVNMKSRAYFTKCFKDTYGMLPTDYVKKDKKAQN